MSEKESTAFDYIKQQQWSEACQAFDQIIDSNFNIKLPRDRMVSCLLGRTESARELGRYDTVVQDCRRLLKFVHEVDGLNAGACVRRRLVHSLFKLRRFNEAEQVCREWLNSIYCPQSDSEAYNSLERIRAALQMANGQKNNQQQKIEDEMASIEGKLESWVVSGNCNNVNSENVKLESSKPMNEALALTVNNFQKQIEHVGQNKDNSNDEQSNTDDGRDWKWRPPPRGFTAETYGMCDAWSQSKTCHYGTLCVEAHGAEELAEWRERFEYRKTQMQKACETEHSGKSYTEQLLDKWIQSSTPDRIIRERVEGVEDACSADLITTVSSKVSKRDWTFVLKTKKMLKAVALLQDAHRNHFSLKQIFPGEHKPNKKGNHKAGEVELTSDQEWSAPRSDKSESESGPILEHRVKVIFSTEIYGTFRQSVVFDFGTEPALVRHLCVDVVPVNDADKIKEIKKEMAMSTAERWDMTNSDIVPFSSPVYPGLATPYSPGDGEREQALLAVYPAPRVDTFTLTQGTVVERGLTLENYRARMHELLYVEELARIERVTRYNVTCKLKVAPSYLLAPSGMAASTAKYTHSGELFALLTLGKDVSEDTSAGRLILNNCTTVLVGAPNQPDIGIRKVYEALIEDKGKNMVYLRLPASAVAGLGLLPDTEYTAEVQFQLNRLTYCEWHYAVDKIMDLRLIFPDVMSEPSIPWSPDLQWSDTLDSRLNSKQKEAVVAITTPISIPLPPILLIGPFGTGKTYTLAQAIKQLLLQSDTRILVCTHSNSAADLYIKDYLHPWTEAGLEDAKPLRVYYHKRWVATVNQTVQKYCLIETRDGARTFRLPTLEDVARHRVVVVTLSISMHLAALGLPRGHFSHVLLDEAAQATEAEALMPLALAGERARVVLAGDHMQLSPELFSRFARDRGLHVSLLERLYDRYPPDFPCKVLLCENYRAHEAIVDFASDLFYDRRLVASGRQPRHDRFYPLTFFTTRGEDVQDDNSTAFYNNSEVYEVVERVCELRRKWPPAWGRLDERSIGIMTPYADQVFRIRSELRKRKMGGISVERVLNVQGKQFRAVFLSTVRTRRTCGGPPSNAPAADADYGFLSNRKLLNTAITRAQSLVAVVGDPVALCSVGRCRKLWEGFIEICSDNGSLFGVTWALLRRQLDGLEFKKTYSLNPLAPEFVPRAMRIEARVEPPAEPSPPRAGVDAGALAFPARPRPAPVYFAPAQPQRPAFARAAPPARPPPAAPPPFASRAPPAPRPHHWPAFAPSPPAAPPVAPPPWPRDPPAQRPEPPVLYRAPAPLLGPPLNRGYVAPVLCPESPFAAAEAISPYLAPHASAASIVPRFSDLQLQQQRRQEKEQIQFLQNVHFPERSGRTTLVPTERGDAFAVPDLQAKANGPGSAPRDHAHLLWYRHLLETQGADSAARFLELATRDAGGAGGARPAAPRAQPPFAAAPPPLAPRAKRDIFARVEEATAGLGELLVERERDRRAAYGAAGAGAYARGDPSPIELPAARGKPLYRRAAGAGGSPPAPSEAEERARWGELLRTYASVLRDEPCAPPDPRPSLYHYFD